MTAAYYKGEVPVTSKALPRAIDEYVMRQIEDPQNIARLPNSTTRHVVTLLIKTGLRTIDATRLPFDPVRFDAAGSPVLLYYNHKLKRDAARPIDDVVLATIRVQQEEVRARYPDGSPWLFPAIGRPNPARAIRCQARRCATPSSAGSGRRYPRSAGREGADSHPAPVSAHPGDQDDQRRDPDRRDQPAVGSQLDRDDRGLRPALGRSAETGVREGQPAGQHPRRGVPLDPTATFPRLRGRRRGSLGPSSRSRTGSAGCRCSSPARTRTRA